MPAGVQMPWLGVVIAGIGLVLLWSATQSMDWVESATLSEFGATAEQIDGYRVVRWYADWGWKLLVAYVLFVAVLSTLVNLTSRLARTLLWLPLVGPFAFFNLTDSKGSAAPRVLGALAMLGPAALLGAVWVDIRVEPEIDPQVEVPSGIDAEALEAGEIDPEDVDPESLPDPETLQRLREMQDADSVDLDSLASLGFEWQGYSNDQIGSGLWLSFAGLAIVGIGAIVGTRAPRR
jgi:hypothetical protein